VSTKTGELQSMRQERSGRFRCIREIRVPILNLDASPINQTSRTA
jgi:hypothetical protein